MNFKKIGLILFLTFSFLPINKTFAETTTSKYMALVLVDDKTNKSSSVISSKIILQNITNVFNTFDGFRQNTETTLEKAQTETQKNINTLNSIKSSSKNTTDASAFQKPLAYAQLFFFIAMAFIFKYQLVFYVFLLALILALIRYLWNLFF